MRSKNLAPPAPWLITFGLVLGLLSPAWGQGTETEPNNTCQTAQAFGTVSLPFSVTGSLEGTPPAAGDVDFLRFTAAPNTVVIADLEGAATGQGTLQDPFLGLFDSNCQPVALNDDGGQGLNSRLGFTVPANGIFIMAVTSCCDDAFTGASSSGTYRLTLSPGGVIAGSISDGNGNALAADFVGGFTPGGQLAGSTAVSCCDGNKATYELTLPAGVYRIVALGDGARVWHHNRPTFQQADNVTLGVNQRITGVDFTLVGLPEVIPVLNQTNFLAGDTLRLDLAFHNPTASAVTIIVSAMADIPAEPGIDRTTFCCFQSTLPVLPATTLTLPAGTNTVAQGFATYHFTGSEVVGGYSVCVSVLQGAITSQRCDFFSFGLEASDEGGTVKAGSKKKP